MNSNILKFILFLPIVGLSFYCRNSNSDVNLSLDNRHTISLTTSISGAFVYLIYTYLYKLAFNNIYFAMSITPKNYIDPLHGSHKIILYGFSTLHALFISLYSTLYLFQILEVDNYTIKQAFFISMSYYLADLYYTIDSTPKLLALDYLMILHHSVIIYYQTFVFIQNDPILENSLLYYFNRGLLAEYSLLGLNYSWYLIYTKQEQTYKMLISSIITLILYFITRPLNFTLLLYNIWHDGLLLIASVMIPLFLINYYWFYKILCKVICIYKKIDKKTI